VDLLPSDEQLEIVSVVDDFLASRLPTSVLRDRRSEPSSIDSKVWAECGSLGWFGLGLAERLGGVGYGMAEEALLLREIGRHLAPGPYIASVLGARVAALAGHNDIAGAVLAGEAVVALAEPRVDDGWFDLIDAPGAAYLLAVTAEGAALFDAAAAADAESLECIDPGVRLSRVHLDAVPALAFVAPDVEPIHTRGLVLVAAMMTGIALATRDLSSQYAKDRQQFGRPIGINQAIKHACADMAVRAEAAASQLLFAALSVDEGRGDTEFQATAARIVAGHAAIENAASNVQVHGGIGYTFEHDAHLFVKRARVLDRMLGGSRQQLAALLATSGPQ